MTKALKFQDKPTSLPQPQVDGKPLKSMTEVLLERRATPHFKPDPVPDEYLEAILRCAGQAPPAYNLQPWRFIVVREKENRERLQKAAMNQEKAGEAPPVVIIAFGVKDDWKRYLDAILAEGVRRGAGKTDQVEKVNKMAADLLGHFPAQVWLNRHTMIALTTMMLMAEALGLDTAPIAGFDAEAVKKEFELPASAEVVALLALGFAREPDKPYGGRLALEEMIYAEEYGHPWITPAK